MSFRFAHIHEYNRFIAIDLGSYRVRAAIYELESWELILKGKASVRQNRKNFLDGSITDLQGVALTIERAIVEAAAKIDTIPDDIILAFSPEVTIFDAITTQYIRSDKDSTITMEEIDSMIKKIEHESLERAKEKSKKQYGIIHDDVRLVSSTLTSITIDGKKVMNPLGFSGGNVRIKVLNVFVPSSEFNIMRSIISSLGKRTISVVPTPLLFSKIVERSNYSSEGNIYLDIGLMHTTIVFEAKNEILSFETFPFGTKMLLEMLSQAFEDKTYLEIENILCSENDENMKIRNTIISEFFQYVADVTLALLSKEKEVINMKNIFLSGWIFRNEKYRSMFYDTFHTTYKTDIKWLELAKVPERKVDSDFIMCYALGILAEELLVTKKDPLIRILRYVLYNYE